MVLLHEEHLRRFVHVWRLALESSVSLPPTDDPAYVSLEALGRHVLSAAGGYMTWMCEVLALPRTRLPLSAMRTTTWSKSWNGGGFR